MRLEPQEVQMYCKVIPIDMLMGTGYCPHNPECDCSKCQYFDKTKYQADKIR